MKKLLIWLEYALLYAFPVVFFFISKKLNLKPRNWPLFLLILVIWAVCTMLCARAACRKPAGGDGAGNEPQ